MEISTENKSTGRKRQRVNAEDIDPATQKKTSRRYRTRFTAEQLDCLEKWFERDAYPDVILKRSLAVTLRVSEQAVTFWFQNRRARQKKADLDPSFICKRKRTQTAPRPAAQWYYPIQVPPTTISVVAAAGHEEESVPLFAATPTKTSHPLKTSSTPANSTGDPSLPYQLLYPSPWYLPSDVALYTHHHPSPAFWRSPPRSEIGCKPKDSTLSIENILKH